MSVKYADVKREYKKDKQLREEDVKAFKEWMEKQPHLPVVSELQLILFLQSCYFSIEMAKTTIDIYFTLKPIAPDLFANRNPLASKMKQHIEVGLYQPLPKTTPEGYRVIFCKFVDSDTSKFVFTEQLKLFDMSTMLSMMQEGTAEGLIILLDMDGVQFGHVTKLTLMGMKQIFYHLQEALPVRLKGLHFINVVPFMDKILALMKPFMKQELLDVLYLHTGHSGVFKAVPQSILPKEYGGTADCLAVLHETMKKRLTAGAEYFKMEEAQVADESKRPGKPKNAGDIFGIEGSFKKLDID